MNFVEPCRAGLAKVGFRLQEAAKGHSTFRLLAAMEQEQWLPAHRLNRVQERRLHSLLQNAADSSPYYADLFRSQKLDLQRTPPFDSLSELPFLTKPVIRENLERLKSRRARRVKKFSTGGSTGAPLAFYLGPTRVSSDVAARMRAESWFGAAITDPEYAIWGSPIELGKQDRLRQIRDSLFRTRLLPAFEMSPAIMTQYLDEIEHQGCRRVFGYASSIALLCEHAKKENRDLGRLGVKAVFVTAEYLQDHWRQTIQEVFQCPVANGYGGRDSGFVAHECPAGGMHVTADRMIVEIIDDRGQRLPCGETGEIVVTHFDTPEMPFIRYRTGDVGTLSLKPCSCGRGLPLLDRIDGRKTDFIRTPDGRTMHALSLIYVLREIEGIENFRITQKSLRHFEVEIVPNRQYRKENEVFIRDAFRARMRSDLTLNFRYCDSIAPAASGKVRQVVSDIVETKDGELLPQ